MKPKVSIVIPTYNGMKFLEKTVESCKNQTYENVEILIIDDCSTDGTKEFLSGLEGIKLITSSSNQGLSANVNKAVRACAGEIVLLLGQDDVLTPNHIQCGLEYFTPKVGLVHCNALRIDEKDRIFGLSRSFRWQGEYTKNPLFYLAIDNFIQSCGLLFRKSIFESFGGWDEQYRLYGEWLSFIKFAEKSSFAFNDRSICYYRVHSESTMKWINKNKSQDVAAYKSKCKALSRSMLKGKKPSFFNYLMMKIRNV